jgi:hypothetical protein
MYLKNGETGMARTKKVVEAVVQDIVVADCTEFVSIAFDKNNNLYGVSKTGSLFKYNWVDQKWETV